MPANFLTNQQIKQKLADYLHVTIDQLTAADWDSIIIDATASSKNSILENLRGRGYSLDQIFSWDAIEDYHTCIALYWCLVKGANLHAITDATMIDKLDRRLELASIAILAGGDVVTPADELVGGVVGGGMLDTEDDRYTRDMEF